MANRAEIGDGRAGPIRWTPWEPLLLAGLVVVAASLRWLSWRRSAVLFDDGPTFIDIAAAMREGAWSDVLLHPFHPLYPAAVRAAGFLTGDLEIAAVLVSIVAGTAAVAVFHLLLRETFDRRTAAIGALLLAVHPNAVGMSSDVQSDGLYLALFLTAVYWLWRSLGDPSRRGAAIGAGIAIGLAYLTRPEGLGLAVVAGVAASRRIVFGQLALRRAVVWGALLSFGLAIVMAPYLGGLRMATGEWMLTQKKSIASIVGLSEGPTTPLSRLARPPRPDEPRSARWRTPYSGVLPRAADYARPAPATALEHLGNALNELAGAVADAIRIDVLLFVLLGLFACRGRPGTRGFFVGTALLLYATVLFALVLSAGYVSRRHALPPLVLLFGYGAVGVQLAAEWVAMGLRRLASFSPRLALSPLLSLHAERAGLALSVLVVVAFALPADLSPRRQERIAERHAAEWLAEQLDARGDSAPRAVAAGRLRIAYYADAVFVPLPSGPEQGMLDYLRRHRAGYVIVDEAKVDHHAGLREALDEGLRLVHRVEAEGQTAAVFEVMQDPR